MKEQIGPTVKVTYSCFECRYCENESYHCQGDSGTDVYCVHPSFTTRQWVGDSNWGTPDFCPFKKDAKAALGIKQIC